MHPNSLRKNQIIDLTFTGMTAEGSAVGRCQTQDGPGEAVFVPLGAVGDTARVKIVKAAKTHAFGRLEEIISPAPCRVEPDCPVYAKCGGCCFRHITYEAELAQKEQRLRDALIRVGGFAGSQPGGASFPLQPILAAPSRSGYRNKALLPIGPGPAPGEVELGFYAGRSHRIVPCGACLLHPGPFRMAVEAFRRWQKTAKESVYNEQSHTGKLRRLYLRMAEATGQVLVSLVVNGTSLKREAELVEEMRRSVPGLVGVALNQNTRRTNVALGPTNRVLWGQGYVVDRLQVGAGPSLEFQVSPLSFYQVNRQQAERLYTLAAELAGLSGGELLLDLYCGTGTIGLSMAHLAGSLVGVEVVPQAVENAWENARRNGISNARFLCADAAQAAKQLAEQGQRPDIIILDPPRKGCDAELVEAVVQMAPQRVIYISCDPATLARDLARFAQLGYEPQLAAPVDMFPGTGHVETIVLLQRENS